MLLSSSGRRILNFFLVDSQSTFSLPTPAGVWKVDCTTRTSEWRRKTNFHLRTKSTVAPILEIRDASTPLSSSSSSRPRYLSSSSSTSSSSSLPVRISEEVREGVHSGRPVVALESAIITHGMPYPHNIQTALNIQKILREEKGVIPATVGVIKGQLTVGLTDQELETLGSSVRGQSHDSFNTIKVSRRDLPFALSRKLNGGTTVTGTIIGAVRAKIPIFVTGGLGGVHRGAELTFDISADLRELGRSPIAVVSAGIKSILDIGKTLEYLETEGVCVCVLKKTESGGRGGEEIHSSKFPSFFTAESPFSAPYVVANETEAANLVHSSLQFGLGSGILLAVPIPKEYAASGEKIEAAIRVALNKAKECQVLGKDMTPFLLSEVSKLTGGESLKANTHLVEHNARVGGEIAVQLSRLRKEVHDDPSSNGGGDYGGSGYSPKSSREKSRENSSKGNASFEKNPKTMTDIHKVRNRSSLLNEPLECDGPKDPSQRPHIDQSPKDNDKTKEKGVPQNPHHYSFSSKKGGRPVVIGGASLDLILRIQEDEIVVSCTLPSN